MRSEVAQRDVIGCAGGRGRDAVAQVQVHDVVDQGLGDAVAIAPAGQGVVVDEVAVVRQVVGAIDQRCAVAQAVGGRARRRGQGVARVGLVAHDDGIGLVRVVLTHDVVQLRVSDAGGCDAAGAAEQALSGEGPRHLSLAVQAGGVAVAGQGDLGAQDLRVGLAPAEVFSRSGVERFYFLNDLRFTPLLQGSRSVIRVVSNRPVREPYLNFIVEVARPNGQLLREYTVLLDPPSSSAYSAVAAPSAAALAQPSTRAVAPLSPVSTVTPPSASAGHRHQVSRGDSLWSIAARLREQGSTLSQQALMEGILALNPNAFAGGDPGRLQAGADLLLPDAARAGAAQPTAAPAAAEAAPALAENTAEGPVSAPLAALEPAPQQSESLELLAEKQRQVDLELANQAAENLQLQQGLAQLQLQLQQLHYHFQVVRLLKRI